MKNVLQKSAVITLTVLLTGMMGGRVLAASNSSLSQVINAGTLTTDIADAAHTSVPSPSVTMTTGNVGFSCTSSSGTLGTNTARLYMSNAGAANLGWTLTIAATNGTTSKRADAGDNAHYDFNDAATSGCSDGADTDTYAGQLRVDPSVSTLTTDCQSCTTASISKGASAAFQEGTTDSITLLNAGAASDDIWRGYLTGVGLTQAIPASTEPGSYSLGLTLTATAQ